MSLKERKLKNWSLAVSSLADKPKITAKELKAAFDSNSNELKPAINGIIDDLVSEDGAENIGITKINGMQSENVQQALNELSDTISKIDPYWGSPVAISQGGTSAKTAQDAIYNLGCGVRKNLLINPFFKINQRGEKSYIGNTDYCVDGWVHNKDVNVTINAQNNVVITPTNTEDPAFFQRIENYTELLGKTVTFSVYMTTGNFYTVTGTLPAALPEHPTVVVSGDTEFGRIEIQIHPTTLLCICFGDNQVAFSPIATKLEIGENQSLARQNSDGKWELIEQPNPLEILKCQKNLLCWNGVTWIGSGLVDPDGQNVQFFVPTPIKMRIAPTAVGNIYIWDGIKNYGPYTFTVSTYGVNGIQGRVINISNSGLTAGTTVFLNTPDSPITGFFAEVY